jgi:hypothetical protein
MDGLCEGGWITSESHVGVPELNVAALTGMLLSHGRTGKSCGEKTSTFSISMQKRWPGRTVPDSHDEL